MSNYFTQIAQITEIDNKPRTICRDDCPQEVRDLIMNIHFDHFFGCLPNDWIYTTIAEAFSDLENDPIENITIQADIWNSDLTEWLNDNCGAFSQAYCNEVMEDAPGYDNIINILSDAQHRAKERIYYSVSDFLTEEKE